MFRSGIEFFLDERNWHTKPYIEAACCLKTDDKDGIRILDMLNFRQNIKYFGKCIAHENNNKMLWNSHQS